MKKRSSFQIFKSVVIALFLREVQTRFGTKRMGYFWALFDAMFMVVVFAGLKSAIADNALPGVDFPVFLATSFLSFYLFKNIVNRSIDAFSANAALFGYKQVKPIDTIIARILLEILISIMATLAFIVIGLYFNFDLAVKDFNMVIFAVVWLCVFAFGIGLFVAIVGTFYENFKKIARIIMTPLLFISALMYTVGSLPPMLQSIVLYNPLVHFMEMIHGNYFLTLDTYFVDYEYMFYWTFVPLYLGLYFYIRSEKKVIAS